MSGYAAGATRSDQQRDVVLDVVVELGEDVVAELARAVMPAVPVAASPPATRGCPVSETPRRSMSPSV